MRFLFLLALALVVDSPSLSNAARSDQATIVRNGASKATAIKVKSVSEEYKVLRERRLQPKMQSLVIDDDQHPYDVLTATAEDGSEVTIWFDIKSFYGKGFDF